MISATVGGQRRPVILLVAAVFGSIGAIAASYLMLRAANVSISGSTTIAPDTGSAVASSETDLDQFQPESPAAVVDPATSGGGDNGGAAPSPPGDAAADDNSTTGADPPGADPPDCPPPLGVFFAEGNSEPIIDVEVEQQSQALAAWLADHPDTVVLVDGHADASGVDDYNLKLSFERAEAVAGLLQEYGIAADRLTARGFGEYQGLPGEPAESSRNRRVEVAVTGYEFCALDNPGDNP